MNFPRMRFTVRRMMIAVALAALIFTVATPVSDRLVWLSHNPRSVHIVSPSINTAFPRALARCSPVPVGQSTRSRMTFECRLDSSIPSGLAYRCSVVARLTDRSSGAVLKSYRKTRWVIAGMGSWQRFRDELAFDLTPRRSGSYAVKYDHRVRDMLGRES